jgi:hypothetical protein
MLVVALLMEGLGLVDLEFLHQHPLTGTVGLSLVMLRVVVEIFQYEMFFPLFLHFVLVVVQTFASIIILPVLL